MTQKAVGSVGVSGSLPSHCLISPSHSNNDGPHLWPLLNANHMPGAELIT